MISPESGLVIARRFSRVSQDACLEALESSTAGLLPQQVADRLRFFGPNIIPGELPTHWLIRLFRSFLSPFNAILSCIAGVSLVMDIFLRLPGEQDFKTFAVVIAMILLSSLLRFFQEHRSDRAAEKLRSMVRTSAMVLRRSSPGKEIIPPVETDIRELVPGDIVLLSAGDMIPADCRLLTAKDLFVSQSVLTGESIPSEKHAVDPSPAAASGPGGPSDICFMGTNVVSGSATAVVIATGERTFFGSVSHAARPKEEDTRFEFGVRRITAVLIRFILVMVPLVFLINGITKGDWFGALLFAVSVAVGLTPEMLPMILTTSLARGAVYMSRHRVIVRRLPSIQNLGAMDVLCADKTGTLTLDRIVLEKHLNVLGENDLEVLKWAYLNSVHQTGLRNVMDRAILEHREMERYLNVEENFKKVDEIPFDFERRRMSVILETAQGNHLLICKGAVEEMLHLCTRAFDPGPDRQLHAGQDAIVPMDEAMRTKVMQMSRAMNEEGLRVMLVAMRELPPRPLNYTKADEQDLVFTGFIGFLDPPKPSARPSLEALAQLGVRVMVVTGDNETVTCRICRDVGIPVDGVLTGPQIDEMDDAKLREAVERTTVMARIDPLQKSRIVASLKSAGHTVGFMGDGINDAPALREADVGISMDTAADIARESADVLLLEKDLTVLRNGVIYGRRTYGNIIKYIKMTASSNFGNMFSVLGASVLLPFLPMLPVQLLVQNLMYDITQALTPWDRMDESFIRKPCNWSASGVARFMLFFGPVSSLFDYAIFAVLYFILGAQTVQEQSLFQSGWFVEGLLSQSLIVHLIRTEKIPFFQSTSSLPVLIASLCTIAAGIYLPFSSLAPALGMSPLPLAYFPWLVAVLLGYFLLVHLMKLVYIGRYGQLL